MIRSIWTIGVLVILFTLQGCGGSSDVVQSAQAQDVATNKTTTPATGSTASSNANTYTVVTASTSSPQGNEEQDGDDVGMPQSSNQKDGPTVQFFPIESSPAYTIATSDNGITIRTYEMCAPDTIALQQIGLKQLSGNARDLQQVMVWGDSMLLGRGLFMEGHNTTALATASYPSLDATVSCHVIMITGTPNPIGIEQPGEEGALIDVAVTAANTIVVDTTTGTTLPVVVHRPARGVRIFKSVLLIGLDQLPTNTFHQHDNITLRFHATALPGGDVPIKRMQIQTGNVPLGVSGVWLHVYSDASRSQEVRRIIVNDITLATNGKGFTATVNPASPITIPAGATYFFDVEEDITSSSSTPIVVSTTLLGDGAYLHAGTPSDVTQEGGSFVWSPDGLSWTSGYGILGFPPTGITEVIYTQQTSNVKG